MKRRRREREREREKQSKRQDNTIWSCLVVAVHRLEELGQTHTSCTAEEPEHVPRATDDMAKKSGQEAQPRDKSKRIGECETRIRQRDPTHKENSSKTQTLCAARLEPQIPVESLDPVDELARCTRIVRLHTQNGQTRRMDPEQPPVAVARVNQVRPKPCAVSASRIGRDEKTSCSDLCMVRASRVSHPCHVPFF